MRQEHRRRSSLLDQNWKKKRKENQTFWPFSVELFQWHLINILNWCWIYTCLTFAITHWWILFHVTVNKTGARTETRAARQTEEKEEEVRTNLKTKDEKVIKTGVVKDEGMEMWRQEHTKGKDSERQGQVWGPWKGTKGQKMGTGAGMKDENKPRRRNKMKYRERAWDWFGDWDVDREGAGENWGQTLGRMKGTDSGEEIRIDHEEEGRKKCCV